MIIIKSKIIRHVWNVLIPLSLIWLSWIFGGMENINSYLTFSMGVLITLLLLTYALLCVRNFDIYIFDSGIGLKNNWRIIGRRKWKFQYNEIDLIRIRLPGPRSFADLYLWINKERFNLLLNNSSILEFVTLLNQKNILIKCDKETKKYFHQKEIYI